MKSVKTIFSILCLSMALVACDKVDFKKTRAGIPYKIFSKGKKADSIKIGHTVRFQIVQKIEDSVLFSTYDQGQSQFLTVEAQVAPPNYGDVRSNIIEIFMKAGKGDSIYMVQATDSLIRLNPQVASQIKPGVEIVTTIRIEDVYKTREEADSAYTKEQVANADQRDKAVLEKFRKDTLAQAQMAIDNNIIEDYLAANKIQTEKTPWGVYFQLIQQGTGPKPAPGQFASVQYKGTNLQGKEFDSGVYPLQIGMGGSIKGFEEGVRMLSKGGRGKVFIPSILGYGQRGSAPKIMPNENLIFELELLEISDKAPAQPVNPADTSHAGHGHD